MSSIANTPRPAPSVSEGEKFAVPGTALGKTFVMTALFSLSHRIKLFVGSPFMGALPFMEAGEGLVIDFSACCRFHSFGSWVKVRPAADRGMWLN